MGHRGMTQRFPIGDFPVGQLTDQEWAYKVRINKKNNKKKLSHCHKTQDGGRFTYETMID